MAQTPSQPPLAGSPQRRPIVELLLLAGPTIAQMVSYTAMQFIDTLMLTRGGGDAAATAAGNSGMFAFAAISFGFGALLLVNTLVSQSYGRQEYGRCGQYLWQGIWFSAGYALLLLPLVPLLAVAFRKFGHDPALLQLEIRYLQIVISLSVVKLISSTLGQFLLAINRPTAVFVSALAGVSVNALAAYALVLGHAGFEPMGVAGAAWAQNIGVTVELLVLVAYVLQPTVKKPFGVTAWKPRPAELGQLLKLGLPSGVQMTSDVLAWSLFVVSVVGAFGTSAMAANTYMFRFMTVSFMPAIGIGSAVTALVGRYIGRGRLDLAEQHAHLGFVVTTLYMVSCGLLFFFARHPLIALFSADPQVQSLGAVLLIFAAIYQVFDAMYILYSSALRGAGDTFVPGLVTGVLCWGVMLLGGYLAVRFVPKAGIAAPWAAATVYGITLGIFMLVRFRHGGWKLIHLDDPARLDRVQSLNAPAARPVSDELATGN
jgi:MATE family multidrug resistance protein